jgi:hypothetical protein
MSSQNTAKSSDPYYSTIFARTGCSTRNLRCRGLTAVMKKSYFPDYRFVSGGCLQRREGSEKVSGMSRGRRVDAEIQKWVKRQISSPHAKTNPKMHKKLHLFSRAFIALTHRLQLVPIGTQVVVRDEQCDIATLVDVVFVDKSGGVVVVELKTGFEGYNERSNARMKREFSSITNAPVNQHHMQLAFTHHMFEHTFPEFGSAAALLIRMTDTGAHVRSLDKHVQKIVRRVLAQGKVI